MVYTAFASANAGSLLRLPPSMLMGAACQSVCPLWEEQISLRCRSGYSSEIWCAEASELHCVAPRCTTAPGQKLVGEAKGLGYKGACCRDLSPSRRWPAPLYCVTTGTKPGLPWPTTRHRPASFNSQVKGFLTGPTAWYTDCSIDPSWQATPRASLARRCGRHPAPRSPWR